MADTAKPTEITGRCYCGATTFTATEAPRAVAYCHCADCRRVTGAPVAAFAGFDEAAVTFTPNEGRTISAAPGVTRSFCECCGSPLTGRFDYLPGAVYIGVGLLDRPDAFPPQLHAHADSRISWLHIDDDLERSQGSARDDLAESQRKR